MRKNHLLFFLPLYSIVLLPEDEVRAQDSSKIYKTFRILTAPKIDGLLDDEIWKNTPSISDFIQNSPNEGGIPTQQTEVKVMYDNFAVYVGAMMYDSAPDSILHELGNRDNADLNAEKFRFVIDPYTSMQDAYDFGVFSSGVQIDSRFSDPTYNGVWQSAVKILSNGWSVEMKIPYSAIRFPNKKEQQWGLQFTRDIRRNREFDQWALTPSDKANPQKYWGTLKGIYAIQPPVRLSLTPYLSTYYETTPSYNSDGTYNYANSFSYNAGADIKYGLNESFTLDMILLPDFGQVQSDNKVKNLSYREVNYEENRPFFKEGVDLFNKNGLFYSRRIGRTPKYYEDIPDSLKSGETIEKNPPQAKLLNATKISGRGNSGMGFGLFNALTDNTYAELKDSAGNTRKILTEPFTNYNVIAFDQQLKNSSSVYFINTNVMRKGSDHQDANVSGSGFSFQDKKNTFLAEGGVNLSQLFTRNDSVKDSFTDQLGYYYYSNLKKISGTWQGFLGHETMSSMFKRSDIGYFATVNYSAFYGNISFNRFKPWKSVLRSFNNLNLNYSYNYTTKIRTDLSYTLNLFVLFKSYFSVLGGGGHIPISSHDYNEPRVDGRYWRTTETWWTYLGISTDYRKKLAVDINSNTGVFLPGNIHNFPRGQGYGIEVKPRYRASDKLSFLCSFNYGFDPFNPGYADTTKGEVIFGARKLHTYINTLTAKYIFKNDLSITLNARQYWNTGKYFHYYTLQDNGLLAINTTYSKNNDFSYNVFNLDAVFSWQFSPGSLLSIVYKNAIDKEEKMIPNNYAENISNTLHLPQSNSISFKILYYLDYQQLHRKKV